MSQMRPMSPMRPMGAMFLLLAACLLFAGCESDPVDTADNRQQTTMEILNYSAPFLDVTPWNTRANNNETVFHFTSGYGNGTGNHLPNGYESYELLHPHTSIDDSTIGVFMTPDDTSPSGNFIYQGVSNGVSIWKSNIIVEDQKHYYIYGFMPRSGAANATIQPLEVNNFSKGATILLNKYDALTTADASVIVGLRWATEDEKINGLTSASADVPLGHFRYVGEEAGKNRLFVLLKHLYAGLHFATKLDPVYAGLRTIRITKVELTAIDIYEKINLIVTLQANSEGLDPITDVQYPPATNEKTNKTITLYQKTNVVGDLGEEVPVDDFNDFLGYLVPGSTKSFKLKTTYDVYDNNVTTAHPEGNLVRQGCVAENVINQTIVENFPDLKAGELFTVNLLIKPTYLYVLSEPDLDNPTITITN